MKIGFIGLRIMGKPMSKILIKASYELVVMDKNLEATRELGDLEVKIVQSPREVAAQVEVSNHNVTGLPSGIRM